MIAHERHATRYRDWPQRLELLIEMKKQIPFAWGRNDCCIFVADCIHAMTGIDVAAEFRGQYRTELGGMRIILRNGCLLAFIDKIAARFQIDQISVKKASRGDVVIAKHDRYALGIVNLCGDAAWVVGKTGLVEIPLKLCTSAWKI
jgi:Domain of unknown function (DUF6950)